MKRGGAIADEENFEDAIAMVIKAVKPTELPSNVKKLFQDPACENITATVRPLQRLNAVNYRKLTHASITVTAILDPPTCSERIC